MDFVFKRREQRSKESNDPRRVRATMEEKGKRKKGEGSSRGIKVWGKWFLNEKASEAYKYDRGRKLIGERGIDIPHDTSLLVRETFKFYGWAPSTMDEIMDVTRNWFMFQPPPVAVDVVHEFYANMKGPKSIEGDVVKVRGKDVCFSAATINEFILYHFLCAKLMPSLHVATVDRERALLLFLIVTHNQLNTGKIIRHSIV